MGSIGRRWAFAYRRRGNANDHNLQYSCQAGSRGTAVQSRRTTSGRALVRKGLTYLNKGNHGSKGHGFSGLWVAGFGGQGAVIGGRISIL